MEYYFIHDLNIIGKIDNFVPYIYDVKDGWIIDNNNILMDKILGYDGESIGNSSELFKVDEITEEEAYAKINSLKE